MKWTNQDWMHVYSALTELSLLYDLKHIEKPNAFGIEQRRALKLKEKLEYMFREEDAGTPTPEEVRNGAVSPSGSGSGGDGISPF